MAKDARIPIRVPEALKEEFQWAAEQDGCRGISTWLRQLGEARAEQLRTSAALNGKVLQVIEATLAGGSAAAFVPGFGLDEED